LANASTLSNNDVIQISQYSGGNYFSKKSSLSNLKDYFTNGGIFSGSFSGSYWGRIVSKNTKATGSFYGTNNKLSGSFSGSYFGSVTSKNTKATGSFSGSFKGKSSGSFSGSYFGSVTSKNTKATGSFYGTNNKLSGSFSGSYLGKITSKNSLLTGSFRGIDNITNFKGTGKNVSYNGTSSYAVSGSHAVKSDYAITSSYVNPQYNPAITKAWVNFSNTGAIISAYNVSSVTKNDTGDYTVNFSSPTPFSNSNYVMVTATNQFHTAGYNVYVPTKTTSQVRVSVYRTEVDLAANEGANLVFFGY
jgi:hypothetical protein